MKLKNAVLSLLVLIIAGTLGVFVAPDEITNGLGFSNPSFLEKPYKLGLDLQGGVRLLYQVDLSNVKKQNEKNVMQGMQNVVMRRAALLGVREPDVRVQGQSRIAVNLAGLESLKEAKKQIGKTPYLEFKDKRAPEGVEKKKDELRKEYGPKANEMMNQFSTISEKYNHFAAVKAIEKNYSKEKSKEVFNVFFKPTKLTGKYLSQARVNFDRTTSQPTVNLKFNSKGKQLLAKISKRDLKKPLAICIDGEVISAPTVQAELSNGKARISGEFEVKEARELARNLNAGALSAPVNLMSGQKIGPSLAKESISESVKAATVGFCLIIVTLLIFYRFSGLAASFSLVFYAGALFSLFKLIPITLTLAGIAGLILSLGIAVDANVLIFERLKEEMRIKDEESKKQDEGLTFQQINNAFSKAWTAIRDGNITTLIICLILFLLGSGFAQGVAVSLILGILTSMFSAMVITKLLVKTLADTEFRRYKKLWSR